jgi:hypothetical protein
MGVMLNRQEGPRRGVFSKPAKAQEMDETARTEKAPVLKLSKIPEPLWKNVHRAGF